MKNHGCATAVALLAAGAVAGCGGEEALTKSAFLKQGNAICAKGSKKIEDGAKKLGSGKPSNKVVTKFAEDTLIPSVEDQLSDLRDLKPPKADEEKVKKILDAADEGLSKTKDDPTVLTSSDDPFKEANKQAEAYGLAKCAE